LAVLIGGKQLAQDFRTLTQSNFTMVILNVDDDKEDREMFCEALKEIDPSIDCLTAHSASEALKMLDSGKHLPNYIFLDINMPVMDGKTCLKRIKKNQKFSRIPIIMYSTTSNQKEIEEYRSLGAQFLVKDISYKRLIQSLRQIIR
jgi:CheY-like chemotaxis protein